MHSTRMGMDDMGIKGWGAPGGPGGHQSERSYEIMGTVIMWGCQTWHP